MQYGNTGKKGDLVSRKAICFFFIGEEEISVGQLPVQAGRISFERRFPIDGEKVLLQGTWYDSRKISQIGIRVSDTSRIAVYLPGTKMYPKEIQPDPTRERQIQVQRDEIKEEPADFYAAGSGLKFEEVVSFDNKWDQLMNEYPQIHPFGDDRVFISIEPKDFIILQASCQKLVNNSFLPHGFYNYRYLILGPDKELGDGKGECFYLGVPGTYFEREKMVAVMFGFEGFECNGAVEIGKFGFYMRRVEL